MIRPSWRIAIRSASCSASSRYCVVSSTVVPWPASSLTLSHTSSAGLRVEPGGRLVEEDHRRVPDQAHGDVEAAAHASGVRRHPAVRRVGELEAGQQVVRDRAGSFRCRSRATSTRFSRPVRISSTAANCPVRLIDSRTFAGSRGDVEAVDGGRPRVGLEQRGQDLHDRGLAGAVGAEQGEDAAPRHVEVDAAQHAAGPGTTSPGPGPGSLRRRSSRCSPRSGVLDRLGQASAFLVDPLLAGVGLRRTSRRTRPGRHRRSSRTGVPSAAARSQRSARSSNILRLVSPSVTPP